MFGNVISEEKRNQSLTEALFMLGAGGLGVAVDRAQAKNILTTLPPVATVSGTVPKISNKWSVKQGLEWLKENIPQVHVVQDTAGGSTLVFAKRSNGFKDVGDLKVPDLRKMEAGSGGTKGTGNDTPVAFRQNEFASSYEARLNQTPSPTNSRIEFEGIRGES